MTLVEKMARTIDSACECRNCGLLTYWENHTQECCDRPSWISASDRNKAIAALKAMREPTESMIYEACINGPDTNAGAFSDYDATQVWQAMIDQAIKEGESHES